MIPNINLQIILETDRLILRQPTVDDASFMLRLVNDPTWLQYIGDRNVHTLEEAKQYLLNGAIKSFADHGFGFGMVCLKETDTCIGLCGFVKRPFLDDVDIGFAFLPAFTRQGYAYEIANATLHYGFTQLQLPRIIAITTPDNLASIQLLKKIGLHYEKAILVEGEALFLFAKDNN